MENEVNGLLGQDEVDQLSRIGAAAKEDREDEHKRMEELCRKEEKATPELVMVDCEAGEKDEDNECMSVSAVKATEEDMGNQKVIEESMEDRLVITANPRNDIQIVEDHVCTPGYIKSLSGIESLRPQINLEVVLDGPQDGGQKNRPITDSSNLSACVAQTQLRPPVQREAKLRGPVKVNPARQGKPTQAAVLMSGLGWVSMLLVHFCSEDEGWLICYYCESTAGVFLGCLGSESVSVGWRFLLWSILSIVGWLFVHSVVALIQSSICLEMKEQGAVEDRLMLLKGISGAFRPGVLIALMVVSGAGKTTLMDVLASRKTGGYVEGKITIFGYPKKQETRTFSFDGAMLWQDHSYCFF
ncbi:Pleiotropic drug resistance protein 1 [Camellia lanceoleosa]|uniref:Pleiotropic drug resistance protein 1 n=1 Tax=Camellia lanceoleosa TaxID=1840588 RepID=A0ACC0IW81_9ERIC|nr:Pleiotropic drug resistance protein 1 [Camellia lanceoleosa]